MKYRQAKTNSGFHRISQVVTILLVLASLLNSAPSQAGLWSIPEILKDFNGSNDEKPWVGEDNNGRAMAVWINNEGNVESAFQTGNKPWSDIVPITHYSGYGNAASRINVVFSPDNSAMAIWEFARNNIQVARLAAGTKVWSKPVTIAQATSLLEGNYDARIRLDAKGNAVASWIHWGQDIKGQKAIRLVTYKKGFGWSSPINVSGVLPNIQWTDLTMNARGDVAVVWSWRALPYSSHVYARNKPSGLPWKPIAQVSSAIDNGGGGGLKVVMDDAGRASAIWVSEAWTVNVAQSSPDGVWNPAEIITNDMYSGYPDIATDKAGNIMAVWEWYTEGYATFGVKARMKKTGKGWTLPRKLSSSLWYELGRMPKVATSPDGLHTVVMWNDDYDPYVTSFTPSLGWGIGWQTPVKLAPIDPVTRFGNHSSISAGPNGSAHAIWTARIIDIIHTALFAATLSP